MSQQQVKVGQVYADQSKRGREVGRTVTVEAPAESRWRREWLCMPSVALSGPSARVKRLRFEERRLLKPSLWRLVEPEQPDTVEVVIGVALCACGECASAKDVEPEEVETWLTCPCVGSRVGSRVTLATVRARIPKPQPRPVAEVEGEVVS